jgi:hypothetical protein
VLFERTIEQRDVADKNDPRAREKAKDQSPNAGWRHTSADESSADSLYQQLEGKLK